MIDAVVKADQTEIFGDEKLVGSRALAALIVPDHFVRLLIEEHRLDEELVFFGENDDLVFGEVLVDHVGPDLLLAVYFVQLADLELARWTLALFPWVRLFYECLLEHHAD